jgi:hypothetical protein
MPAAHRKWPIGTHVSVYWEADGLRYPARVITAPNGQKRTSQLKDQVYVKFKDGGTWDLVPTEHVAELDSASKTPDDPVAAPPGVVELIAQQWKDTRPSESSTLCDLMSLAYLTEDHGVRVLPMILRTPMTAQMTQAYNVARSVSDPQWLLSVLSALNAPRDVGVPHENAPADYSEDTDPDEPDSEPVGAKRRRIESDSESSETESSNDSRTRYGAPIDAAQRTAILLTTPVTSVVQHQRARDAFARVLIAMDGKADVAKSNAVALHYAALLRAADGAVTGHLIQVDSLANTMRDWEKSGHLQWRPDHRPRTSVASAIVNVLNNLPGARYVLWRAVWDVTDTMRGDISPTRWELLTCAEFPVDRKTIPCLFSQKCWACNKTRSLTERFTWSLGGSMHFWNTGSDCSARITLARYAHSFVQQVEMDAHDPPCPMDKYFKEWDLISKRIDRVVCGKEETE